MPFRLGSARGAGDPHPGLSVHAGCMPPARRSPPSAGGALQSRRPQAPRRPPHPHAAAAPSPRCAALWAAMPRCAAPPAVHIEVGRSHVFDEFDAEGSLRPIGKARQAVAHMAYSRWRCRHLSPLQRSTRACCRWPLALSSCRRRRLPPCPPPPGTRVPGLLRPGQDSAEGGDGRHRGGEAAAGGGPGGAPAAFWGLFPQRFALCLWFAWGAGGAPGVGWGLGVVWWKLRVCWGSLCFLGSSGFCLVSRGAPAAEGAVVKAPRAAHGPLAWKCWLAQSLLCLLLLQKDADGA